MSDKRFVLYEHKENYYILKNPRIHLDFIEMLGDAMTSEEIVDELNQLDDKVVELAEENEQLKKKLESLQKVLHSEDLFDKSKDNQIRQNGLIMNTDEVVDLLNSQSKLISAYHYEFVKMGKENKKLKEENEQLRKENTALDKENAEHLADNIKELDLLEKLTKFLHECDLTNEQRALFHDMITEEDLQPNLEVE